MKNIIAIAAAAMVVGSSSSRVQEVVAAGEGLSALNAMTFECPKAGLNAAAREAAKARSQGTYQFSYFSIVNDSHHALYEIHFKSNYRGEPELKYCVALYCQQGWDPKKAQPSVKLMTDDRERAEAAAHRAGCTANAVAARRPAK